MGKRSKGKRTYRPPTGLEDVPKGFNNLALLLLLRHLIKYGNFLGPVQHLCMAPPSDLYGASLKPRSNARSWVIRPFGDLLKACWGPLSGLLGTDESFFWLFPHYNYNRTKMFWCLNRVFGLTLQVKMTVGSSIF